MADEFTDMELAHIVYAGKLLTYMHALRFFIDYRNSDIYYGSRYDGHNFMRAKNQMVLLEKLMEKERY
jgi:hypothetical protein